MDFTSKQWPPLKRSFKLLFFFFHSTRWNSKLVHFGSLGRVMWRHRCWWPGEAPVKIFTTRTLSLGGMLPGFTDLPWKGLCFYVSLSFSGFQRWLILAPPPQPPSPPSLSVVSVARLFHLMAFRCQQTQSVFFVDVRTRTKWNSVQHQMNWSLPLPPFFNNWILFLLASCINPEVVHSLGSLYYNNLKHSSWHCRMIGWF